MNYIFKRTWRNCLIWSSMNDQSIGGGIIITVLFRAIYLKVTSRTPWRHTCAVRLSSVVYEPWQFLQDDCNWSIMTLFMKDNLVDPLAFQCPTSWFYVRVSRTLILGTSFDSWIVLLHLPSWDDDIFQFLWVITKRLCLLVKMVHLNKELAYGPNNYEMKHVLLDVGCWIDTNHVMPQW